MNSGNWMYWATFVMLFISLCAREGKKADGLNPLSRILRRLYEFGSRNKGKDTSDEKNAKNGV